MCCMHGTGTILLVPIPFSRAPFKPPHSHPARQHIPPRLALSSSHTPITPSAHVSADGSKLQTNPDGSSIEVWTDGRKKQSNTNGTVIEVMPDGTILIRSTLWHRNVPIVKHTTAHTAAPGHLTHTRTQTQTHKNTNTPHKHTHIHTHIHTH